MERLWAPWRSKYLYDRADKSCIFCIPAKTKPEKDRSNYILERSKHAFSILNKYPYNNGHIMISPYRHVRAPEILTNDEFLDMFFLIKRTKQILDDILKPHGYNIGMNIGRTAGAGFDGHAHMHIVPRWDGDTNFMPVLGNPKVISESLEELYELCVKHIQATGHRPQTTDRKQKKRRVAKKSL